MFTMALALRFPGGEITVPSLAARDKQEADENNSAGSWAVSGRVQGKNGTAIPQATHSHSLRASPAPCPS